MQRGGPSSVPRIRTSVPVTGTVSATGTQPPGEVSRSAMWKSTLTLAQQAPQLRQGSAIVHSAPQHFLYFLPLPQGQGSLRPVPLFRAAVAALTATASGAGKPSARQVW